MDKFDCTINGIADEVDVIMMADSTTDEFENTVVAPEDSVIEVGEAAAEEAIEADYDRVKKLMEETDIVSLDTLDEDVKDIDISDTDDDLDEIEPSDDETASVPVDAEKSEELELGAGDVAHLDESYADDDYWAIIAEEYEGDTYCESADEPDEEVEDMVDEDDEDDELDDEDLEVSDAEIDAIDADDY